MTTSSNDDGDGLGGPPWSRVDRVQLIRRQVTETLSPSAIQLLFQHAEHVVEGSTELGEPSKSRVYATVMVTIDLDRLAPYFREPADEATAQRVAELVEATAAVHGRLMAIARPELGRLGSCDPANLSVTIDLSARAQGTRVLIDGDAVGTIRSRTRSNKG